MYFTNLRTVPGNDLLTKLEKLIRRAGISNIDFDGKFTAIKIHFGEPGNMAYIRPIMPHVLWMSFALWAESHS